MLYRPKAKTMLFWNGEYVSMSQNVLQHTDTDTSNTEMLILKTRYQSILSFPSLYWFFFKLFSNNFVRWRQVLTNLDFLLSKLGPFNDFIMLNFSERHNLQKFKVGLSPKQCVICFIESLLKMMKIAFYFILKALFVLKILKI